MASDAIRCCRVLSVLSATPWARRSNDRQLDTRQLNHRQVKLSRANRSAPRCHRRSSTSSSQRYRRGRSTPSDAPWSTGPHRLPRQRQHHQRVGRSSTPPTIPSPASTPKFRPGGRDDSWATLAGLSAGSLSTSVHRCHLIVVAVPVINSVTDVSVVVAVVAATPSTGRRFPQLDNLRRRPTDASRWDTVAVAPASYADASLPRRRCQYTRGQQDFNSTTHIVPGSRCCCRRYCCHGAFIVLVTRQLLTRTLSPRHYRAPGRDTLTRAGVQPSRRRRHVIVVAVASSSLCTGSDTSSTDRRVYNVQYCVQLRQIVLVQPTVVPDAKRQSHSARRPACIRRQRHV